MLQRHLVTEADTDMGIDAMRPPPRPGRLRRAGGFQVWRATTGRGATCIARVHSRKLASAIAGAYDWIEDCNR